MVTIDTICPTLPGPEQGISKATDPFGKTFNTYIHGPQRMLSIDFGDFL